MACILIVDDEKENREALQMSLGDENPAWEILTASDVGQGLNTLRDQVKKAHPVDVLLTDLVMATESDGMTMLEEARLIDPLVMAILFTAKEKSLDRYAAFDIGAFDVVEKNIRGTSAAREINIKTRAALRYREWCVQINFLRRYFDPQLFDTIRKDPSVLATANRLVTISFWDIRGFSRLCEILKAHPTLVADFLREYCDLAAKVIFKHGGLVDKFIGDGVMALFGVLDTGSDNGVAAAEAAVSAAVELRNGFEPLLAAWMEKWTRYTAQKIDIGLGCGIHTGDAIVGNAGTDFRDQFTALGPEVNLASRIEARSAAGQVLLSQSTHARVQARFATRLQGEISDIKNIPGTFAIYEVERPRDR